MGSDSVKVLSQKLIFDEKIYSIEAIQKAAYRYINSFTLDLSLSKGKTNCLLVPNKDLGQEEFEEIVDDFKKEILDQHLRLRIKSETEPVRNLILGIAFSNTTLQSVE
jgi:His-Xaa-Ser system protein HxsD